MTDRNQHLPSDIRKYLAIVLFPVGIVGMFFYSFTQIDLNLTLTKVSLLFALQDFFQHIGYFDRPLSVKLYLSIVLFLYLSYIMLLRLTYGNKLSKKYIYIITLAVAGLLYISYPAFSYDIFNYIFDARIITLYGENPYVHKALDYPTDSWLLFMRWTHRTYPYGPLWLVLTIPLSLLGLKKILLTMYLFKLLMAISYVASVEGIRRIVKIINSKYVLLAIVIFALNPLVITESIISSHNDIVMMVFSLWSLYFLIKKKHLLSIIFLIASVAIKFATVFLLPVYIYVFWKRYTKKSVNWNLVVVSSVFCMIMAVIVASFRTTFQPWYLLFILAYSSLLPQKYYVVIPTVVLSLVGTLNYVPFLYTGNWDPPIPVILKGMLITGIFLSITLSICYLLYRKHITSK